MGEATAAALAAIPASPHAPRDVRGGAAAGTSERLARFIVDERARGGGGTCGGRLLYLTGDKNRDTLPNILKDAGLTLENMQVYATQGSSRFEEDLQGVLDGVRATSEYCLALPDHCLLMMASSS